MLNVVLYQPLGNLSLDEIVDLLKVTVIGIAAYWFLNFNLIRQRRLVSLYCIFLDGFIKIGRR